MIQVDVRSCHYHFMGVMLRLDQLFSEFGLVVVVNHGQGSHHDAVFFHVLRHSVVPYQIANGFRAIFVALLADGAIKPIQQIAFERNSRSNQR